MNFLEITGGDLEVKEEMSRDLLTCSDYEPDFVGADKPKLPCTRINCQDPICGRSFSHEGDDDGE